MKQKQIALFTLLSFCIAGNMVSCLDISKPSSIGKDTNLNLKSSSQGSLKDILPDDEIKCEKEKGFSVKSTEDFPPAPEPEHVHITKDDVVGFYYGKKNKESTQLINAQGDQITSKYLSIGFKDEYKIRLKTNEKEDEPDDKNEKEKESNSNDENEYKKKFYSEANFDVKDLNEVVEKDLVKAIFPDTNGLVHLDYFDELDRLAKEEDPSYDVASLRSSFTIELKDKTNSGEGNVGEYDKKVRELLSKLRKNKFVKYVSVSEVGTTSNTKAVPAEPIFSNDTTPISLTSSFSPGTMEMDRYHYARTGAYDGWGFIKERNTNSDTTDDITMEPSFDQNGYVKGVSIAVIDVGFNPSHLDNPIYDTTRKAYCTSSGCTVGDNAPNAIDFDFGSNNPINKNHGGREAGIIGARINGIGSAGLASYPTQAGFQSPLIVPLRIESFYNSSTQKVEINDLNIIAKAINQIIESNISSNNPVRVINLSISPSNDKTLEEIGNIPIAINRARNAGILVVNSAGNENRDVIGTQNIALVVGGTARNSNQRWTDAPTNSGSNYGKRIDISAPAEKIFTQSEGLTGYELNDGTSESAPIVASIAALVFASSNSLKNSSTTPTTTYIPKNSSVVDYVKNILVFSGKPILTDQLLGFKTSDPLFTNIPLETQSNTVYSNPNGTLVDMYNALKLSNQIPFTGGGGGTRVRLFNTDYYSEAKQLGTSSQVSAFYKEDKVEYFPSPFNDIEFKTYNKSCSYSWGYQIWQNGVPIVNHVSGIAGKSKPRKRNNLSNIDIANNVFDNWITKSNSGMVGWSSTVRFSFANNMFTDF